MKFKYIDKWKGKSGKWIYKYPDDKTKTNTNVSTTANRPLGRIKNIISGTGIGQKKLGTNLGKVSTNTGFF